MEIKVNNNISPKTYLLLSAIFLVLFIVLGRVTINNVIKVRDSVEIDATIEDITSKYDFHKEKYNYYITLNYEYNGVTYITSIEDNARAYASIGSTMSIHINPQNPEKIYPEGMIMYSLIGTFTTLAFSLFCIMLYKKRKEQA